MATLQQLAELVGGQVQGDPSLEIARVYPIDQAGEPTPNIWFNLTNVAHRRLLLCPVSLRRGVIC